MSPSAKESYDFPPQSIRDVRKGMGCLTDEWGWIWILKAKPGRITFEASGGRGAPGVFESTPSIVLVAGARWYR